MIRTRDLKRGMVVRKVNGKNHAEVLYEGYHPKVRWFHSDKEQFIYNDCYWVEVTKEEVNMNSLYEVAIDGSTKIATKLMEKSNKAWIMELKGSNEVVVVDPKDVSEIVPYTIEVNVAGTSQHYQADEGTYSVDDLFVMGKTLQLARVVKLDTKNKAAKNTFKPYAKLLVEL